MMARLTIRTRLMLLTCAGLFVLIATNAYLTKKLAENSAGMSPANPSSWFFKARGILSIPPTAPRISKPRS